MKKKNILKIMAAAVCAVALFVNVSVTDGKDNAKNTSILNLITLNEANAECPKYEPWCLTGKCLVLSQVCVGNAGGEPECGFGC